MNSRSFAVERGPVLAPAWSTATPESGYHRHQMPDMPAAAAAAISPVVPATAPPEPYARCWPAGQVDAGACFPYFGALYGSSLPPPSYRVQPGCMANLGQFWPPTPPPDGCGRFEGAGNLYFCSPLTSVFRHSESVPQNLRGSYHGLGPYSHLVDVHKEQNLHSHRFKRESSVSPNSNLSYMTACPTVSKPEGATVNCVTSAQIKRPESVQKQKLYVSGKCSQSNQQKLCQCYECHEKGIQCSSSGNTDKENVSNSTSAQEQRYSDERLKSKDCRVTKDNPIHHRNSVSSNIGRNFNCSTNQQIVRTNSASIYTSEQLNSSTPKNISRTSDGVMERSSSALHYSFPQVNNVHTRCASNSSFPFSSVDATYRNSAEKIQQHSLQVPAPGYDACPCSSTQLNINSSFPKNDKNCCFTPSYPLPRTLYSNLSDNSSVNQKSNFVVQNTNFNISPLKNVYFSHIESENFHLADNHNFLACCAKQNKEKTSNLDFSRKNTSVSSENLINYSNASSLNSNAFSTANASSKSCNPQTCGVPNICQSDVQKNFGDFSKIPPFSSANNDEVTILADRSIKNNSIYIKQEKEEISDCKFHSTNSHKKNTNSEHYNSPTTPDCLNLSVSVKSPKVEVTDLTHSCAPSTVYQSWASLPSQTLSHSSINSINSENALNLQKVKSSHNNVHNVLQCFGNISNSNHVTESNYKIPEAVGLKLNNIESQSTVPEDIVSVAQIAPSETDFANNACKNNITTLSKEINFACESDRKIDESNITEPRTSPVNFKACNTENSDRHCNQELQNRNYIGGSQRFPQQVDCYKEEKEKITAIAVSLPSVSDTQSFVSSSHHHQPVNKEVNTANLHAEEVSSCSADYTAPMAGVKIKTEPKDDDDAEMTTESTEYQSVEISGNVKIEQLESTSDVPEQTEISSSEPDVKCEVKDILTNDSSFIPDCKEFNGLYLLVHSIDLKSSVSKLCVTDTVTDSCEVLENRVEQQDLTTDDKSEIETLPFLSLKSSSLSGLSALCALAEHRIVSEFQDKVVITENSQDENGQQAAEISSNYPVIKEDVNPNSSQTTSSSSSHISRNNAKSDQSKELQTRKRLAELQTQYKEVQKELARLKSKKTLPNKNMKLRASGSEDIAVEASGLSECSSEDCSGSSDTAAFANVELCTEAKSQYSRRSCVKSSTPQSTVQVKTRVKVVEKTTPINSSDEGASDGTNKMQTSKTASNANTTLHCQNESNTSSSTETPRRLLLRNRNCEVVMISSKISKRTRTKSNLLSAKKSKKSNSDCKQASGPGADESSEIEICENITRRSQNAKDSSMKQKTSKNIKADSNYSCKKIKSETTENLLGQTSSKGSKRKPDNPKKYMPAKKGRLTETIVAKQLRNRILFETHSCSTDEECDKQENDVSEELFDAFRKCNLGKGNTVNSNSAKNVFSSADDIPLSLLSQNSKLDKMCKVSDDHLTVNQRILAMEDGLFYAGYIKEIAGPDAYGIALDGQRGNKIHVFSKEEMLNDTILELKPSSMSEVPEGTRVCAYWSQQYRCLYPGTVVKASSPSADWSEPRVFVEFDDGDSGQIPLKNIRFLPQDTPVFAVEENHLKNGTGLDFESKTAEHNSHKPERKGKRGRARDLKKHSRLSKKAYSNKRNSALHKNDSSPEECFCDESDVASSQSVESQCVEVDLLCESAESCAHESEMKLIKKDTRRQSKKNSGCKRKSKANGTQIKSKTEKCRKHKKYKERHKHHHHRHHRHHHRHSHRHHHSKKHKHHRRTHTNCADYIVLENCYENVTIPSTSIPCDDSPTKSTRNQLRSADDHSKCAGHSKKEKLPQLSSAALLHPSEASPALKLASDNMCSSKEQLPAGWGNFAT